MRVVISHNAPVTVLSEQGVIGFALFLILIVGTGWAAVRGSSRQGDIGWARWTLGAMLAGLLVHSLLYAALFEDPFTWIIAAAAVSLAAGLRDGPRGRAASPPRLSRCPSRERLRPPGDVPQQHVARRGRPRLRVVRR